MLHASLKPKTQKIAKKSPPPSQLRHLSTIGKELLNINIFSTCPHNMVNFGPLTAEICWRALGTPTNFNGFRVLPSLLQRRRSRREANETLHDVWSSPGLVYYIGALTPDRILPGGKYTLRPSPAFSYISAALLHGTRAMGVSQTMRRGIRNRIKELL